MHCHAVWDWLNPILLNNSKLLFLEWIKIRFYTNVCNVVHNYSAEAGFGMVYEMEWVKTHSYSYSYSYSNSNSYTIQEYWLIFELHRFLEGIKIRFYTNACNIVRNYSAKAGFGMVYNMEWVKTHSYSWIRISVCIALLFEIG